MPMKTLFFAFEGRIDRGIYWTRAFPVLLVCGVIVNLAMLAEVVATGQPGPFSMILSLLGLWPSLAVTIKRLHDRNRSGWFLLIVLVLIPVVGAIWLLVEVWFLKGTDGPNRFGDQPVQGPLRLATVGAVAVACVVVILAAGYFALFEHHGPYSDQAVPLAIEPDSLAPATDVPAETALPSEAPSALDQPADVRLEPSAPAATTPDLTRPAEALLPQRPATPDSPAPAGN